MLPLVQEKSPDSQKVPKSRLHPMRLRFSGLLPALSCTDTRREEEMGRENSKQKGKSERRRDEVNQGNSCITINEYYASLRDLSLQGHDLKASVRKASRK